MKTAPRVPARLYWYVVGLWALACAAVGGALMTEQLAPSYSSGLLIALVLMAFIGASGTMPLMLSPTVKIHVGTAPLFAAALLFPVPIAVCIGLGGTLAYHAYLQANKRRTWIDTALNSGRTVLQVALAGTIFRAVPGGSAWLSLASTPSILIAALPAGLAYYVINVSAVYGAASIMSGRSPLLLWWSSVRIEAPQQAALLLFGLVTAVVVRMFPILGLAMVFPVFVVYYSLRGSMSLRAHTQSAIEAIADAVDMRAFGASGHSRRVADLAGRLAERLDLSAGEVELVRRAARVHDIGKVGFSDNVLRKRLVGQTNEPSDLKMHPAYGAEILSSFPEYQRCRQFVRFHHERPDGAGYPDGKSGNQIPLGAAIIGVAEAFDALTTDRPYRQAVPQAHACAYLESGAGTAWNGAVVQVLIDEVQAKSMERRSAAVAARAGSRL